MDIRIQVPGGSKITIPYCAVDAVGIEERASSFTKRSIKKESKLEALHLAISMVDLTTLEGMDTEGKVRQMCGKAVHPINMTVERSLNLSRAIPSVAAVCVYPNMVGYAVEALQESAVQVASVASGFPAGLVPLKIKLADVKAAVQMGANEIDMVIDRGAFLSGQYQKVFDEIFAIKQACGKAHLKVILETGELQTYDSIRTASWLAMEAGADFIKTSTGKVSPAATMGSTLVMLQAIDDYYQYNQKMVGMKPAGGIREAKQAIHYLCMVREVLGEKWLDPDWFRFGASALLNDLLRQVLKQETGRYFDQSYFALD